MGGGGAGGNAHRPVSRGPCARRHPVADRAAWLVERLGREPIGADEFEAVGLPDEASIVPWAVWPLWRQSKPSGSLRRMAAEAVSANVRYHACVSRIPSGVRS